MNISDVANSYVNSINQLYTYFAGIGVDGKEADQLVTRDLALIQKPLWIVKSIQRLLFRIGFISNPDASTDVRAAIATIRAQDRPDLTPEITQKQKLVLFALESIRSKKDPHLVALKLYNRWKTKEHRQFQSSIDRIYTYFTMIGIRESRPDRLVTCDLKLIPKLTWPMKTIQKVFADTQIPYLLNLLREFTKLYDLDAVIQQKISLILSVLDTIKDKKDPQYAALRLINLFRLRLDQAHCLVDKAPYSAYLLEAEQKYANKEIGNVTEFEQELSSKMQELATHDAEERAKDTRDPALWSTLPDEVWRLILGYVPAEDGSRSRRVCKKWNAFMNEPAIWKEIARQPESRALFSSLAQADRTIDIFLKNRAHLKAIANASATTNSRSVRGICHLFDTSATLHSHQQLVLSDAHHYHVLYQNRFVQIPRPLPSRPITVGENFYSLAIGPVRGVTLISHHLTTLQSENQFHNPDLRMSQYHVNDKKIFFILRDKSVQIFDIETKQCLQVEGKLPAVDCHYCAGYVFHTVHGCIAVQPLDDLLKEPTILSESKDLRFATATQTTLFAGSPNNSLIAIDLATGKRVGSYDVGARSFVASVHQGMLIVQVDQHLKMIDLLTMRPVRELILDGMLSRFLLTERSLFYVCMRHRNGESKLLLNEIDLASPSTTGTKMLNACEWLDRMHTKYEPIIRLLQSCIKLVG